MGTMLAQSIQVFYARALSIDTSLGVCIMCVPRCIIPISKKTIVNLLVQFLRSGVCFCSKLKLCSRAHFVSVPLFHLCAI